MATKVVKKPKPVDLSEYAEEAIPFDAVIRKLAHVKPANDAAPKPRNKVKKRAK